MTREPAFRLMQRRVLILFFTVACGGLVARGDINVNSRTNNYETPPPVRGSIPWENDLRLAQERQEIYRTRIPIPGATAENIQREQGALSAGSHAIVAGARGITPPRPAAPVIFQKTFFYLVLFLVAGIYAWRRYAPESFARVNLRYNPLAAGGRDFSPDVRSEDESFAKFAEAFRTGPSPAGSQPANLLNEFYAKVADAVGKQRVLLEKLKREADTQSCRKILEDLRLQAEMMKDGANFPQTRVLWQLASALSGLLKQLAERTGTVIRTAKSPAASSERKDPVSFSGPLADSLSTRRQAPASVDSLTEEFLTCASVCAKPLRELCQSLLQCPDEKDRQGKLADAFLGISALISLNHSGISHPAFQLAVALEGLLKKMLQDAKHSTDSALGTVVTAADLLDELCSSEIKNDIATDPPVGVLVVDDDLLMRRVIAGALQTFFARPEIAESGEGALEAVAKKSFDVIFMDITMPGMDGFETCANIRKSVLNGTTPVVFVTSLTDFQTHAKMSHIGGNDLMAKPFLTAEINVKALTYALRGRMERSKAQPVAG